MHFTCALDFQLQRVLCVAIFYVYQCDHTDDPLLSSQHSSSSDTPYLSNPVLVSHSHLLLAMAPEIKFTPFGIPYIVEFANVAFRKRSKSASSSTAPTAGASTSSVNLSRAATQRSATIPTTTLEVNLSPHDSDGEGLFVSFASSQGHPHRRLSETRLLRLKHRIANAVVAAGMDTPPAQKSSIPERCVSHGRIHTSDLRRAGAAPAPSSFYQGTYGQVMSALKDAGLTTTPCHQSGFADGESLVTVDLTPF